MGRLQASFWFQGGFNSRGWKLIRQRHRAVRDGIEQFNWYSREWQDHSYVPECIRPFMDEIQAFSEVSQEMY